MHASLTADPITPTAIPPLVDRAGPGRPYRLYRAEHLPFDALPAYEDGGPALVAVGGWHTSCTITDGQPGVVVNVRKISMDYATIGQVTERHPIDGLTVATRRDADRAKYAVGAIAFMVYEDRAGRYGLPTGE